MRPVHAFTAYQRNRSVYLLVSFPSRGGLCDLGFCPNPAADALPTAALGGFHGYSDPGLYPDEEPFSSAVGSKRLQTLVFEESTQMNQSLLRGWPCSGIAGASEGDW